jgi:hypothetical protein
VTNKSEIEILFLDKLDGLENDWDALYVGNTYWSSAYLKVMNAYPPYHVLTHFALVKKEGKPVAKFTFQYLEIKLSESFGKTETKLTFPQKLKNGLKQLILPFLNFHLVVSGNTLLSGNYGNYMSNVLTSEEKPKILMDVVFQYKSFLKNIKLKANGILMKDFEDPEAIYGEKLVKNKFTHFSIQPKMRLDLSEEWKVMDDYLAALKSKYRVRYKRARKKFGDLVKKDLDRQDLHRYKSDMYQAYRKTVDQAGFNLFLLHEDYFIALDEALGDKLKIVGIFEEEQLIAFYTLVINNGEIDAHYLGYDVDKNYKYQLYQNMLYYMVEDSINSSMNVLHMSRTALEIKSSIGATPENINLYAKHYNSIMNKLVPYVLDITVPEVEWQPRNPFK